MLDTQQYPGSLSAVQVHTFIFFNACASIHNFHSFLNNHTNPSADMYLGMWCYCGHFQLRRHLWPLDGGTNHLIQLAIANHSDCCFKFHQNWHWETKVRRGQSADSSSLRDYIGLPSGWTADPRLCVFFKHGDQSHPDMCSWCPSLTPSLAIYHSNVGVLIKKSDLIRPTQLGLAICWSHWWA